MNGAFARVEVELLFNPTRSSRMVITMLLKRNDHWGEDPCLRPNAWHESTLAFSV